MNPSDVNVIVSMTVAEANFVLSALGSQPYNQVNGLITKIKDQAEAQLKALTAPKAEDAPALVHEADEQVIPAN